MPISQRDVYLLPHPIGPEVNEHPFIVLSTRTANEYEDTFVCVMITSSPLTKDDYSFDLSDDMFTSDLKKDGCHVKMHLITLMINESIIGKKLNEMKPFYFRQLMKAIGDLVFDYSFTPL